MIFELAGDFADALAAMPADHPRRRMLRLLQEAVRRDIHFVARHPTTLFQCVWNTGWWYDCPEAAGHFAARDERWTGDDEPPPWLRTGDKMYRHMEQWREAKRKLLSVASETENNAPAAPRLPWIRSLRPPRLHLGTAQRAILYGHAGPVTSVAFSPDGTRVASGSSDGTVSIWETRTGKLSTCISCGSVSVRCVQYLSSDGRIAVGLDDGTVQLFDSSSIHASASAVLSGHAGPVYSLAFAHDGQLLVTGSQDESIRIWNVADSTLVDKVEKLGGAITSVDITPDGRYLLMVVCAHSWADVLDLSAQSRRAPTDHTGLRSAVCLRDMKTEDKSMPVRSGYTVRSVAFSPDARRFVTGSGDRTARLGDMASGDELIAFGGHTDDVLAVAVSRDGRQLVTSSADSSVRFWNVETGSPSATCYGHIGPVLSVSFAPDGQLAASGGMDGTVRLWAASGGEVARYRDRHIEGIERVLFSPDGRSVASAAADGRVMIWDTESGTARCSLQHQRPVVDVAFSPDDRRLAAACMDGTVRIWDVQDPGPLNCLGVHKWPVLCVAFSPDGTRMLSGSAGRELLLSNVAGGSLTMIRWMTSHTGGVTAVAFSADGRHFASGSCDKTVCVRDTDGKEKRRLATDYERVYQIAFSPNGRTIAASCGSIDSGPQLMYRWSMNTGRLLKKSEVTTDVSAVQAHKKRMPFLVLGEGAEVAFHDRASRTELGWFGAKCRHIAASPGGRVWAGATADTHDVELIVVDDLAVPSTPRSADPSSARARIDRAVPEIEQVAQRGFRETLDRLLSRASAIDQRMELVSEMIDLGRKYPREAVELVYEALRWSDASRTEMFTYAVFGAYVEQGEPNLKSLIKLAESEHLWVRFAVAESLLAAAVNWSRMIPEAIESAFRIAVTLLDSEDVEVIRRVCTYLADAFVARLDANSLSTTGKSLLREFEAKTERGRNAMP